MWRRLYALQSSGLVNIQDLVQHDEQVWFFSPELLFLMLLSPLQFLLLLNHILQNRSIQESNENNEFHAL